MDLQKQIGPRKRDVVFMRNKDVVNKASTCKPKNNAPPKDNSRNMTDHKGKEKK